MKKIIENMNCPYCGKEMVLGYIQCRDDISWSKKQRKVAAIPPLDSSGITLASGAGPFSGVSVKAYRCYECKKIVIDYESE